MKHLRYIVVPFLAALALSPLAVAQEKTPAPKPVPRESLRYDGKPFEYWRKKCQDELTSELRPERKIEGIRAMRPFGANGYGAEAAAVIVELVRTCREGDTGEFERPDGLSREELVFYEAVVAMRRIGTPGVPAMLAQTDHPRVWELTGVLLVTGRPAVPISADMVPTLVQMASSKKAARRDLAILILSHQRDDDWLNGLAMSGGAEKLVKLVLRNMRDPDSRIRPHEILRSLAGKFATVKPCLIGELRELKVARQKDVEDQKKANYPVRIIKVFDGKVREEKQAWSDYLPEFYSESRWASVVVVNVLATMGPAARDALPELREALQDPYGELQVAARKAIERIEGKRP